MAHTGSVATFSLRAGNLLHIGQQTDNQQPSNALKGSVIGVNQPTIEHTETTIHTHRIKCRKSISEKQVLLQTAIVRRSVFGIVWLNP